MTDIVNGLSITQCHTRNLSGKRFILAPLNNTVLVVEDNNLNMKLFNALLKMGGYNVLQAKDGTQGWELAREHRPDLILMDIQLPGLDGLELTRTLKQDPRKKDIIVVAMTAHAMAGEREKCLAAGMDDYLSKPFGREQLLGLLRKWLPAAATDSNLLADTQAGVEASCLGSEKAPDVGRPAVSGPSNGSPINRVAQQRYLWGPLTRESGRRVIGVYLSNTPELIAAMRRAVASRDFEELGKLAHQFKSSSAMLGADHLAELRTELCQG